MSSVKFSCENQRIKEYYERYVTLQNSFPVTINIHSINVILVNETKFQSYFPIESNTRFFFNDILVLTCSLGSTNSEYIDVTDSTLFLCIDTYDCILELNSILTMYSSSVILLNQSLTPKQTIYESAFVIHLDKSVDRFKYVTSIYDYYRSVYMVVAPDIYQSDDLKTFTKYHLYMKFVDEQKYKENKWHSYTSGSIGLALSSLILLNFCKTKNIQKFMIHEDDIVINNKYENLFKILSSSIPSDSDVVYWGIKQGKEVDLEYVNDHWYTKNCFSWGTHSYSIENSNALEVVSNTYKTFFTCIDCYSFHSLKCYVSCQSLFVPDEVNLCSMIRNDPSSPECSWGYSLSEFCFPKKYNFSVFNGKRGGYTGLWKQFTDSICKLSIQEDADFETIRVKDIYENRLIFFDFIDREFGWDIGLFQRIFPDGFPYMWTGILHHPYTLKYWGTYLSSSHTLSSEYMKLCLRSCKFLIVLSPSLKKDILNSGILCEYDIPVHVIYHIAPEPTCPTIFDISKVNYLTFVGWSFRKYDVFIELNSGKLLKKILPGTENSEQHQRFLNILNECNTESKDLCDIDICRYLPYNDYLKILSESIIFLDFDGVSANNSVLEAITYNIPTIVPDLEATRFYFGEGYPLYFTDKESVEVLLQDKDRILQAHLYLKSMDKSTFTKTYNLNIISNLLESLT